MISSMSSLAGMIKSPKVSSGSFTVNPVTSGTSTVIGGTNYKVYTLTNTTTNYPLRKK